MSTSDNLLTSPVGEIQFMALNRKVTKSKKPDSPEGYAVRIKLDGNTPEGAAFKKALEQVNPGIIGKTHVDKKGEYTVRAFTQYDVILMDANGNELEEAPNFYKDSTGTASITVQTDTRNELGGSIYLVGVTIHTLNIGESAKTNSRQDIVEKIRAQLNASNN